MRKKWWVVGLLGLLLFLVGFGIYGLWRYQAWLPLVTNQVAVSVSNPDKAPISLASKETMAAFMALLPETAQKRRVVFKFHTTMPEANNSYAFMKDSTWGQNGVGVACGNIQELDQVGWVKKVEVYVTTEELVNQMGLKEASSQINGIIRSCLIQALVGGELDQQTYRALIQKINQEFGSSHQIELEL